MGCGSWDTQCFVNYATTRGMHTDATGVIIDTLSAQEMYKARRLNDVLNPHGVIRECCDNDEHPNTIPVILALDVTGSMGGASVEVAKKLNEVMTKLYTEVKDVEFLIMGIGDYYCDAAPIQASQFESDIRIAEQLDKLWFEGGGGGNDYESYTGAWFFGSRQCKLDAWKRGKKGIIITMGDEPLNPYISKRSVDAVNGLNVQGDIETEDLYKEASEKYDIYHLVVKDYQTSANYYADRIKKTWGKYLDSNHLFTVGINDIAPKIVDIIVKAADAPATIENEEIVSLFEGEISW